MDLDNTNSKNTLSTTHQNILFIGGGNITTAIVSGLTKAKTHNLANISITIIDHNQEKLNNLKQLFNIKILNNVKILDFIPDIVILAVKPFAIQTACKEIISYIKPTTLVISVAAGISTSNLRKWLPENTAIMRAMPNTPAAIGFGMTVLYYKNHNQDHNQDHNKDHNQDHMKITERLFKAVGEIIWASSEEMINTTMAIAGCGPAYVLLLCESLISAAQQLDIPEPLAKTLICQTLLGASELFKHSEKPASTLRHEVTSPKGTTAAALEVLNPDNMKNLYTKALQAAVLRAKTIERELTK